MIPAQCLPQWLALGAGNSASNSSQDRPSTADIFTDVKLWSLSLWRFGLALQDEKALDLDDMF